MDLRRSLVLKIMWTVFCAQVWGVGRASRFFISCARRFPGGISYGERGFEWEIREAFRDRDVMRVYVRATLVSHLRRFGFFLRIFPPLPRWATLWSRPGTWLTDWTGGIPDTVR